jgi:transposase
LPLCWRPRRRSLPVLTTDRDHLRQLFDQLLPDVVVIEACTLAGWVHDFCAECGLACHVANTAAEAWKFKHSKRKTDRDDALRLAQLFALGQLPTVVIPPLQTRQWRALIAYRQALVGRRVAVQNRIRSLFVGQGLPAARAPTQVRLPPQTLRRMTPKRIASSARQLVASRPG